MDCSAVSVFIKPRILSKLLTWTSVVTGNVQSSAKRIIMLNYLPRKSGYAFNGCAG